MMLQSAPVSNRAETSKYFEEPSCGYRRAKERGDFLTFIILLIDPCFTFSEFTTSASIVQDRSSSKSDESEFRSWLGLETEFMVPEVVSTELTELTVPWV